MFTAYRELPRDGWKFTRRGWKYETTEDLMVYVDIYPEAGRGCAFDKWIELTGEGKLTIKKGYAWDGPSGPTWDSPETLLASLIHDAGYQLTRERKIAIAWRKAWDLELLRFGLSEGMAPWRVRIWYWGLRIFAGRYARPV